MGSKGWGKETGQLPWSSSGSWKDKALYSWEKANDQLFHSSLSGKRG